jgi:hypothetical protein
MREKLIGFFGAVFRTDPDLLRSRIVEIPKEQGIAQDSITIILWLSDSDYSKALLKTAGFSKVADTPIPGGSGRRIIHADDVDFLYGWYCATGDTAALEPMLNYVLKADWSVPDSKPGYAAAMLQYFCEKDLRAWTHVAEFVRAHPVDGELRDLFNAMLKTKPANQALAPTSTSVTIPADAGLAPAVAVAHL